MALIRHAFHPEPDIQKLASIMKQDASLTAKLFKTVNSVMFGLKFEVKSVQQAISTLGIETMRSLIISIAVGEYFVNNDLGQAINSKRFCSHSMATSIIMRNTSQLLGIKDSERLFLLGLLHDIGIIALDSLQGSDYGEVLALTKEGLSFEDAEKEVFGLTNKDTWKILAKNWGFPDEILELNRGSKDKELKISVRGLTEDSSMLAESMGFCYMEPFQQNKTVNFKTLSFLSSDNLQSIGEAVHAELSVAGEILNLPPPDSKQVNQILFRITHQLSAVNQKFKKNHNELKLRVTVLEEMAKVFTGIIKSLHGDSVAFSVLESLIEGFNADGVFLFRKNTSGSLTGLAAQTRSPAGQKIKQFRLSMKELSPALVGSLTRRASFKVSNPLDDSFLKQSLGDVNIAWLSPIFVRGRFTAAMGIGVKDMNNAKFLSDDFGKVLDIIAGEVGLSMENSRLYTRVQKEAKTDSLTSISNRRTIMKVLSSEFARFKRKASSLTVAIFDLVHFKSINDSLGHLAGDKFLMKTARILQKGMRESDYIGRYGGDEFMAVFPDTTAADAETIVDRVRKNIQEYSEEYNAQDLDKKLSISVGLASADEKMTCPDDLIRLTDQALYKAKAMGRNTCAVLE